MSPLRKHRIRQARSYNHNGSWSSSDGIFDTDYEYDANGNLQTLSRYATDRIDNLAYSYDGNKPNQLKSVADNSGNNLGIKSSGAGSYTYDGIGNLLIDQSEEITHIDWSVYGKIREVEKATGNVAYTYDAQQNRLSKDIVGGGKSIYIRDASALGMK